LTRCEEDGKNRGCFRLNSVVWEVPPRVEKTPEPGSGSQEPNLSLKLGYGFAMATQFGAGVLGGVLVGSWLDRRFHLDPWGTMGGALLGMVAGFQGLFVLTRSYQKLGKKDDRQDRPQGDGE
jgi:F0F1-type ATP synthase assembly protein I